MSARNGHKDHDAVVTVLHAGDVDDREGDRKDGVTDGGGKAVSHATPHSGHAKRADIDGLRGIAVLLVLWFHATPPEWLALPGGFVGVDVFFVLSGYLITGTLLAELLRRPATGHHDDAAHGSSGSLSLSRFYARRICRLMPMATLVLLGVCTYSRLFASNTDWHFLASDARAAALNWANYHFYGRQSNYFDATAAVSWVLHYWSLSVEEQFYFVWPLVLAGCFKLRESARIPALAVCMCLIAVLSWMYSWYQSGADPGLAYYSAFSRVWAMAAGGGLALLHAPTGGTTGGSASPTTKQLPAEVAASAEGERGVSSAHSSLSSAVHVGAVVLLLFCSRSYDDEVRFPGASAVVPVLCTLAMLHVGRSAETANSFINAVLSSRILCHFGAISYSLYLLHWPALRIADTSAYLSVFSPMTRSCIALVVAYVLAVVCVHTVENPLRYIRTAPWRVFLVAGCTTLALFAFTQDWTGSAPALKPHEVSEDAVLGAGVAARSSYGLPAGVTYESLESLKICHLLSKGVNGKFDCVGGDPTSTMRVLLVGDSHAAGMVPAFHLACQQLGIRFHYFSKGACPLTEFGEVNGEGCLQWRAAAWDAMKQQGPFDLVVNARSTHNMYNDARLELYRTSLERTLDRWGEEGVTKRVLLLRDNPWMTRERESCLQALRDELKAGVETPTHNCDFALKDAPISRHAGMGHRFSHVVGAEAGSCSSLAGFVLFHLPEGCLYRI